MDEKPPFDPVRAAFYLVAAVIGTQCLTVLVGLAFCWVHPEQEHMARCADMRGSLLEMLAAALAAALAFAGGFSRKDK